MTFNIHMWKNSYNIDSFDYQLDLIKKINPDILFLQEATWQDKNDDKIKKFIKLDYKYFILSNNDYYKNDNNEYIYYGNILFSKLPIIYYEIISLNIDYLPEKHSCIYANINNIHIFGCHLDVYDNSDKSRLLQLTNIFKKTKKLQYNNIILLGDFNLLNKYQLTDSEWNYIQKHDLLRNVHSKSEAIDIIYYNNFSDIYDYLSKKPPKFSCCYDRRIDYIFINNNTNLNLYDINIVYTNVSDHLPLILDIKSKL